MGFPQEFLKALATAILRKRPSQKIDVIQLCGPNVRFRINRFRSDATNRAATLISSSVCSTIRRAHLSRFRSD